MRQCRDESSDDALIREQKTSRRSDVVVGRSRAEVQTWKRHGFACHWIIISIDLSVDGSWN